MDMNLLHSITLYAMYAGLAICCFVVLERAIFYGYTLRQARLLESSMTLDVLASPELPKTLTDRDSVPAETLRQMLAQRSRLRNRDDIEDLSGAIYIAMKARLEHHLWMLDTIVTAAPPSAVRAITVHMTVAVARSPSSTTCGLLTIWYEPPCRPVRVRVISSLIAARPFARPSGPSRTSPSSANSAA